MRLRPSISQEQLRLGGEFTHRRPLRRVELVQIDRRLAALEASPDPEDATLVAQVINHLEQLLTEIDRVRPEARTTQPWEYD